MSAISPSDIMSVLLESNWTLTNDSVYYDIIQAAAGAGNKSVALWSPSPRQLTVSHHVRSFINRVAIPALLVFGAVGNAVSLAMLAGRAGCYQKITRRSRGTKLQPLERSAIVGLAALAMSDLFFCLVGIPAVFKSTRRVDGLRGMFLLYYTLYRVPLHNLFLFSSTWIAVSVSSERFFAICFPLRARWYLKVRTISHWCFFFNSFNQTMTDRFVTRSMKAKTETKT